MVYTNDYIYRFISGKLGKNRKHSEVINKILAGYLDADGSVGIVRNTKRHQLRISLTQAAVNDPDFEILRAFHKFYKLGTLTYRVSNNPKESSRCDWKLGTKDTIKLYNLVAHHMIVKGKEFEKILDIWTNFAEEPFELVTSLLKEARKLEGPIKKKKHPSWAWMAGYIAGDGHLCCRLGRKRKKFDKKVNKYYNMTYNELYVVITGNKRKPLEFLKENFKGSIYDKGTYFQWRRSLGKGHLSFSENFLISIKPYMLHPKKYDTINRMLSYLRACRD